MNRLPWRRCGPLAESSAIPLLATGGRICCAAADGARKKFKTNESATISRSSWSAENFRALEWRRAAEYDAAPHDERHDDHEASVVCFEVCSSRWVVWRSAHYRSASPAGGPAESYR